MKNELKTDLLGMVVIFLITFTFTYFAFIQYSEEGSNPEFRDKYAAEFTVN